MSHTRQKYLESCQICTKRAFDMKKGMTCSLTQAHANYETPECPNFDFDGVAADKKAVSDALRKVDEENSATFGLAQLGIKNQIVAGLILLALALTWLIVGLSYNLIFYYPLILLGIGIFITIRGIIAESKKVKRKKDTSSPDILDDKLI